MCKKTQKKTSTINKIRTERAFLNFIADSPNTLQVKFLLNRITCQQYSTLREIAVNALAGNLAFVKRARRKQQHDSSEHGKLVKLSKGTLSLTSLIKIHTFLKPYIIASLQLHDVR